MTILEKKQILAKRFNTDVSKVVYINDNKYIVVTPQAEQIIAWDKFQKDTTITIPGYFTPKDAEAIKNAINGTTYMNFCVKYSNEHGNCSLRISTSRPDTNEQELTEMFYHYALTLLAQRG